MSRYAPDGMTRVEFVPTIANKAAPTTTELNAGTPLANGTNNFITKDGLVVPTAQNMVDDSSLSETFDAQTVGSFGGPLTLTGKRNNAGGGTDTMWNLIVYGLTGYIVIRRGVASSTAWTASQPVEVYPVIFHEPVMANTASNEQAKFSAMAAVTSQPNVKAVVA